MGVWEKGRDSRFKWEFSSLSYEITILQPVFLLRRLSHNLNESQTLNNRQQLMSDAGALGWERQTWKLKRTSERGKYKCARRDGEKPEDVTLTITPLWCPHSEMRQRAGWRRHRNSCCLSSPQRSVLKRRHITRFNSQSAHTNVTCHEEAQRRAAIRNTCSLIVPWLAENTPWWSDYRAYRATESCRSVMFSLTTWILICWKVIMEF